MTTTLEDILNETDSDSDAFPDPSSTTPLSRDATEETEDEEEDDDDDEREEEEPLQPILYRWEAPQSDPSSDAPLLELSEIDGIRNGIERTQALQTWKLSQSVVRTRTIILSLSLSSKPIILKFHLLCYFFLVSIIPSFRIFDSLFVLFISQRMKKRGRSGQTLLPHTPHTHPHLSSRSLLSSFLSFFPFCLSFFLFFLPLIFHLSSFISIIPCALHIPAGWEQITESRIRPGNSENRTAEETTAATATAAESDPETGQADGLGTGIQSLPS